MRGTRVTSTLGAAAVAGIAAWASWSHMVHVALRFGERPEVAYVLPLSVDGLLVVASAAMVDDKAAGREPRKSAKVAFAAGVAASIAANVTAAQPSIGARAVAAWPALALLLVVELMTRKGRRKLRRANDGQAEPADVVTSVTESESEDDVIAESGDATTDASVPAPRVSAKSLTSRARVERAASRMPKATVAQIAAQAGVSESTARRYLPRPVAVVASSSGGVPAETAVDALVDSALSSTG